MKMMGAAEFKKHCLRVIDEVNASGESVTITKRGHPVAELKPALATVRRSLVGLLKSDSYRFDDPDSPAYDRPWNAELGISGDED